MVTFDRLTVGLVVVAIAVLACFAPAQSDTWWHLRMGIDILRTHHVPLADPYSYTAAGAFFSDHGWLSDVIFAGLHRLGGMPLLEAATAAAIVFAWGMAWRLSDGPFEAALICLLGGVAASTVSWAIRPQVFSMAALMTTCALLVSRRFWLLPFVFLVWANLHSAVILGLVALGGAIVAEAIEERRVPVALVAATFVCAVTTLFTPVGLRFWPEVLSSLQRSKADALIEWRMPDFTAVMWPFWAAVVALPVAMVLRRRRLQGRTMMLALVALVLLPLAVRSVRNVAMFMLVAAPAMTSLMQSDSTDRVAARARRERTTLNAVILGAASLLGVAIVAAAWRTRTPALGWQPLAPDTIQAIASCPDPIYNTFEGGGALIWFVPDKKVFIDNRQDPYSDELLHSAHQVEVTGQYAALFERYGIRCAVVSAGETTDRSMASDPGWRRTAADARWRVYVRR